MADEDKSTERHRKEKRPRSSHLSNECTNTSRFAVSAQCPVIVEEEEVETVTKTKDCRSRFKAPEEWVLSTPHPGGPQKPELLYAFRGHVAYALWKGQDRGVLHCHGQKVSHLIPPTIAANDIIQRSKLAHLRECVYGNYNVPLISAFVERWHPETNTFHLPFGEMTITLHDVWYILGIPVEGAPLSWSKDRDQTYLAPLADMLGESVDTLTTMMDADPGDLPFEWIKDCLDSPSISDDQLARGYLLLLLSGSLFVKKSKSYLQARYSYFLQDLDSVGRYAWGAGTLARLYRQLGLASRAGSKQIGGCLTLLEAWIYAYFPKFRPLPEKHVDGPYVLRWSPPIIQPRDSTRLLIEARNALNSMSAQEVFWTPFGPDPSREVPITLFHGKLHCLYTVEPYMPDRVVRQFGYVQRIPGSIYKPTEECRPANVKRYLVRHDPRTFLWEHWHDQCMRLETNPIKPYMRLCQGSSMEPDYMEWYRPRTHWYVVSRHGAPPQASAEVVSWTNPPRGTGEKRKDKVPHTRCSQSGEKSEEYAKRSASKSPLAASTSSQHSDLAAEDRSEHPTSQHTAPSIGMTTTTPQMIFVGTVQAPGTSHMIDSGQMMVSPQFVSPLHRGATNHIMGSLPVSHQMQHPVMLQMVGSGVMIQVPSLAPGLSTGPSDQTQQPSQTVEHFPFQKAQDQSLQRPEPQPLPYSPWDSSRSYTHRSQPRGTGKDMSTSGDQSSRHISKVAKSRYKRKEIEEEEEELDKDEDYEVEEEELDEDKDYEVEEEEDDDEKDEDEEEELVVDEEQLLQTTTHKHAERWMLLEPHEGGPQIPKVLYAFRAHVANTLWDGQDRGILHCHSRTLCHLIPNTDKAEAMLQGSGLAHLRECTWAGVLDEALISAFVERWHPETNSFHFSFGEMTITLHDVVYIMGLPVIGHALTWSAQQESDYMAQLCDTFGQSRDMFAAQFSSGGVPFQWLLDCLGSEDLSDDQIFRGYLMLLLSEALFPDKSKSRVGGRIISFMDEVDTIASYSWGAGCLAYLYRQMGMASRASCAQITGCLTLLQAWIYAYFPRFRPHEPIQGEGRVYASRFRLNKMKNKDMRLKEVRNALDHLAAHEVLWTPFHASPGEAVEISLYRGLLHFIQIDEPYMPDRVMRQFGYVQQIPRDFPYKPLEECRWKSNSYILQFSPTLRDRWPQWRRQCLRVHQAPHQRASYPHEATQQYYEWFKPRTHMYVIRREGGGTQHDDDIGTWPDHARLRYIARLAYWLHPSRADEHIRQCEYYPEIMELCRSLENLMPTRPPPRLRNDGGS